MLNFNLKIQKKLNELENENTPKTLKKLKNQIFGLFYGLSLFNIIFNGFRIWSQHKMICNMKLLF